MKSDGKKRRNQQNETGDRATRRNGDDSGIPAWLFLGGVLIGGAAAGVGIFLGLT